MKHKIKHKLNSVIKADNYKGRYRKVIILFIAVLSSTLMGSLIILQKRVDTRSQEIKKSEQSEKVEEESKKKSLEDKAKQAELENAKQQAAEIEVKIHEIIGEDEKYYGIYYCDLNTGIEYCINDNIQFHAASTIKVPIAMMVADKLYNNEIEESTLIEYMPSDETDGAGILQGEILPGDKIEVSKLMKYMIQESDNIATSMLKRNVGSIRNYINNVTSIKADIESNFITPRQSYLILKKLYGESGENFYYKKVIQYMKETSTHDRIDKYIPNNIVAHKIGDYDKYINDVGIIYTKEPYILVVYTKDIMEEGRENIAKISQAIYEIKTDK